MDIDEHARDSPPRDLDALEINDFLAGLSRRYETMSELVELESILGAS